MNQDDDELLLEEEIKDKQAKLRYIKKKARQLANDSQSILSPIVLKSVVDYLKKDLGVAIHFKMLDMSERYSGQYIRVDNVVGIVCNKKHHSNRQRFTVAHEIGHFVLDHQFKVREHQEIINLKTKTPIEREANIFAAELLMPKDHLIEFIKTTPGVTVPDIARHFQVSDDALWFKIESDNLVKYL
jgi:Zn-dependent peptidase ImmA (M78 family)